MNGSAPLANTITLGVRDLDRQRAFYEALRWPVVFDDGDDFVVFELRGILLALFPLEKLALDARVEPNLNQGGIRSSIIISVDSADEVDALAEQVRAAGGMLTKPPVDPDFFEGRDAYFTDPEGNFWEIAYAPADHPVVIASRRAAGLGRA